MTARTFLTWIGNGFRHRRRRSPYGDGRIMGTWRRGDLAGCASPGRWYDMETGVENQGPKFGDILRVSATTMERGWHMLQFETWPGQQFCASEFRKIVPVRNEACKPAFADKMKRLRPKVDA